MPVMFIMCFWMLFSPLTASPAHAAPNADAWPTVQGGKLNPVLQRDGKISVLLFVMTDCPIANSYAPEINRIIGAYTSGEKAQIAFTLVYVDPDLTVAAARKHMKDYNYHCMALLDPRHTLAQKVRATVTPEAVVLTSNGKIVYRGRVDNRVVDFGKSRHQATRADLRLTLDALLRGEPAPSAQTPCVGCFISGPKAQ